MGAAASASRMLGGSAMPTAWKTRPTSPVTGVRKMKQGNRVKGLCGEEAFEEVVVPSCGFSFEAQ